MCGNTRPLSARRGLGFGGNARFASDVAACSATDPACWDTDDDAKPRLACCCAGAVASECGVDGVGVGCGVDCVGVACGAGRVDCARGIACDAAADGDAFSDGDADAFSDGDADGVVLIWLVLLVLVLFLFLLFLLSCFVLLSFFFSGVTFLSCVFALLVVAAPPSVCGLFPMILGAGLTDSRIARY